MDAFVTKRKPAESDNDAPASKRTPPNRDDEVNLLRIPYNTLPDEKSIEAHFVKLAEVQ